MQRSIIGMIENGIFGIPFIGADICGFTGETDYEMCLRWQQVRILINSIENDSVNQLNQLHTPFY
jgi:alpha-glucosidase (family GH31 glycosyl hydrolase)